MASTSNQNSSSTTGWEITPFIEPNDAVTHQSNELPVEERRNTGKNRTTKLVETSHVYFKFLQRGEGPPQHALELYDENSSPEMEEGATDMEHVLPFPNLLKGWMRETRERSTGARDKFYFHETSSRTFRSVIEVVEYIKKNNNLGDTKDVSKSKKLKGGKSINPLEASASKENKRKNNWNQLQNSESKKTRSLADHLEKTPEQIELEKFYTSAYENLLNMFPSTPTPVEENTIKKLEVEAFLAEAQENLLRTFEVDQKNEPGNTVLNVDDMDPEEIEKMVEELNQEIDVPQILLRDPEPRNDHQQSGIDQQERGNNGLSQEEMEVVEILSNEGLDRSKSMTSDDINQMMPNSFSNFDPIDPDFFSDP